MSKYLNALYGSDDDDDDYWSGKGDGKSPELEKDVAAEYIDGYDAGEGEGEYYYVEGEGEGEGEYYYVAAEKEGEGEVQEGCAPAAAAGSDSGSVPESMILPSRKSRREAQKQQKQKKQKPRRGGGKGHRKGKVVYVEPPSKDEGGGKKGSGTRSRFMKPLLRGANYVVEFQTSGVDTYRIFEKLTFESSFSEDSLSEATVDPEEEGEEHQEPQQRRSKGAKGADALPIRFRRHHCAVVRPKGWQLLVHGGLQGREILTQDLVLVDAQDGLVRNVSSHFEKHHKTTPRLLHHHSGVSLSPSTAVFLSPTGGVVWVLQGLSQYLADLPSDPPRRKFSWTPFNAENYVRQTDGHIVETEGQTCVLMRNRFMLLFGGKNVATGEPTNQLIVVCPFVRMKLHRGGYSKQILYSHMLQYRSQWNDLYPPVRVTRKNDVDEFFQLYWKPNEEIHGFLRTLLSDPLRGGKVTPADAPKDAVSARARPLYPRQYGGGGRRGRRRRRWEPPSYVPPPTEAPPPRFNHAACACVDSMFIFGGTGKGGQNLNDLWRFELERRCWIPVESTTGLRPPPLCDCVLVCVNKRDLVVHGGRRKHAADLDQPVASDVYRFFRQDTKKLNEALGNWIVGNTLRKSEYGSLAGHVAVPFSNQRVGLVGGDMGIRKMNDSVVLASGWIDEGREFSLPLHLAQKLKTGDYSDVTLVLHPSETVIKAHKCVLACRSEEFRKRLMADASSDTLEISGFDHDVVAAYVAFLYTGNVNVKGEDNVNEFLRLAKEFGHGQHLEAICRRSLDLNLGLCRDVVNKMKTDFLGLYDDPLFPDLRVICSRGEEKIFQCHKVFLTRSAFVDKCLHSGMIEELESKLTFQQLSAGGLDQILRFLYTDEVQAISSEVAVECHVFATLFKILPIATICRSMILGLLQVDNVLAICSLFEVYVDKSITSQCVAFVVSHYEELRTSPAMDDLSDEMKGSIALGVSRKREKELRKKRRKHLRNKDALRVSK